MTFSGAKDVKDIPDWIRRVSYLRGLDGRLPDHKYVKATPPQSGGASQQPAAKEQKTATPETVNQFESAEGQSQFDYLRRLATEVREHNAKLNRKYGSHIGAVGVLGSDVYDKLLILQALRPELPEALFFTTDLDELLLPQKKARYTRNLLVASSFGLTLGDEPQADIPPFRNTYQTSIFRATKIALDSEIPLSRRTALSEFDKGIVQRTTARSDPQRDETSSQSEGGAARSNRVPDLVGEPLLYQIGRTAPQTLPTAAQTESSLELGSRCAVFMIPLLLLGILFSFARVRRVCLSGIGSAEHDEYSRRSSWMRAGLVSLVVFGLWARLTFGWPSATLWLTESGLGEPVSISEGVSIWPTIGLHALGLVVSLFMIWCALHSLEITRRDTWREMGVTEAPKTFCEAFWEVLSKLIWDDGNVKNAVASLLWSPLEDQEEKTTHPDEPRKSKRFIEIAGGYGGNWKVRCIRAGAWTLLMMLLWFLVLAPIFGDPNVPARGYLAIKLYYWVTIPDVILTLFLTFLVADAMLYSRALIARLKSITTIWPIGTITKFTKEFDLEYSEDLADWLDMRYLARRTRYISGLIYLPFIAFALLIISRMQIFDDFSNPWTLTIAQAISMIVVMTSVCLYRRAAEDARDTGCKNLNQRIVAATGAGQEARASQLKMLLDDIQNLSEGAFAPWSSQPIVRAVLLPLVTFGGTWLLRLYALPGM